MEISGQLLSVETVIRHTKTHPVLPRSVSPVYLSPCLIANVLSFCLAAPFSLMFHLQTFFKGQLSCTRFKNILSSLYSQFTQIESRKLPETSSHTMSISHCSYYSFSWLSLFLFSYFSHSTNAFYGCNETWQSTLRVRGHSANGGITSRVYVCVRLCFGCEDGLPVSSYTT